jgi:hypothetical protein
MQRKMAKHCEGCRTDAGARYRTLLDLFLCEYCYAMWRGTGQVPLPDIETETEGQRW